MKYFVFLLFPFLLSAQTHRFIYDFQYKSDSLAEAFERDQMILDVNPDDVKFYPYSHAERDSLNTARKTRSYLWEEHLPSLTRKRNSNTNTSYILLNDFFKIDSNEEMRWRLSPETKSCKLYVTESHCKIWWQKLDCLV